MRHNNMPQQKEPRNKEEYIQFMRGPITDLVKRHAKDQSDLDKGNAVIDRVCQAIVDKKD